MKKLIQKFVKSILRRPSYKGQLRLFNYFFQRGLLNNGYQLVKPLNQHFKINSNTKTWIGAQIVYLGDYEPQIKAVFRKLINVGDTILDVGANVGFHTLYFAQLTGSNGNVIAFEPVMSNFKELNKNIDLNDFSNIVTKNMALSDKEESLHIVADTESKNPGAFNLFETGGDTVVKCVIGDDLPEIKNLHELNFIKIDVEGYEYFVLNGLQKTIDRHRPKIVFEHDVNYQLKTGLPANELFNLLKTFDYQFYLITNNGLVAFKEEMFQQSGNVLAIQKHQQIDCIL